MDRADLEQLIDAELKALPAPRAPETLLPRVLAAAAAAGQPAPWYARPWLAWPRAWQVTSAALLVALGAGLAMLLAVVPQLSAGPAPRAAAAPGGIRALLHNVEQAATLARVLWQVLLGPAASWLLIVAISLSAACAAVWTALERAAVGETK